MMILKGTQRHSTYRRVRVEATSNETDREIRAFALVAAGLNRSNIFGSYIHHVGQGIYLVDLHTD